MQETQVYITKSYLPRLFHYVPSLKNIDGVAAWWYGEVDRPDRCRIVSVLERTRNGGGRLLSIPPGDLVGCADYLMKEIDFCGLEQGVEKLVAFMWKLRDEVWRNVDDEELKSGLLRLMDIDIVIRYSVENLRADIEFIHGMIRGSGLRLTYPRLAGAWAVLMLVRIKGYRPSIPTGSGEGREELEVRSRHVAALAGETSNHINGRLKEISSLLLDVIPGSSSANYHGSRDVFVSRYVLTPAAVSYLGAVPWKDRREWAEGALDGKSGQVIVSYRTNLGEVLATLIGSRVPSLRSLLKSLVRNTAISKWAKRVRQDAHRAEDDRCRQQWKFCQSRTHCPLVLQETCVPCVPAIEQQIAELQPLLKDNFGAGIGLSPELPDQLARYRARVASLQRELEPLAVSDFSKVLERLVKGYARYSPKERVLREILESLRTVSQVADITINDFARQHLRWVAAKTGLPSVELLAVYLQHQRRLHHLQKLVEHGRAGRIHVGGFSMMTPTNPRMQTSRPNWMGVPRDLRWLYQADEDGILLDFDFGQHDIRMLATLSGDPVLIDDLTRETDLYAAIAKFHFGDLAYRSVVKHTLLASISGSRPDTILDTLDETEEEKEQKEPVRIEHIKQLQGYIRERYVGVGKYQVAQKRIVQKQGRTASSLMGYYRCSFQPHKRGTVARNAPIQASGADDFRTFLLLIETDFREQGLSARTILPMHDGALLHLKQEDLEATLHIFQEARERTNEILGHPVPVPITIAYSEQLWPNPAFEAPLLEEVIASPSCGKIPRYIPSD